MAQPGRSLQTADRIGFATSMLCAVHCAALPVLMALLPTLGLGSQGWVDLDQGIVVFATVLAATTLTVGWRRHRAYHAWGLLLPALLLLWLGAFGPFHAHGDEQQHGWLHWGLMVSGGLLLALAHLANMRLTHRASMLMVTKGQG
ncbi:hypothetical protein CO615_08545 [Lysobacteraceae bacterium NML75-0749]|nr:hypothetical protein CO615_08545 [Xanthomonadaceae bacterium NML75-0749]PJK05144.1 hypothetical protein CO612_05210 [Xanthomonadaceae bacterium NML71-0210]